MINSLIKSWKKSSRLKKYSRILSQDHPLTNDGALDEIIKLAFWSPNEPVIRHYNINEKKLKEKYNQLLMFGAGQYFRGHWVAASSLVFGMTLDYLFDEKNQMDSRDNGDRVAYRLIQYFEKGRLSEVYEGQIDIIKSKEMDV